MLDVHTPDALREVWRTVQDDFGPLSGTSTIYHFGIEEATGRCIRFVYRSESDWESERWDQPGLGLKPPPVDGFTPEIETKLQTLEGAG